eukprot:scaffold194499_cov47-Attheya_sp.AAC.2
MNRDSEDETCPLEQTLKTKNTQSARRSFQPSVGRPKRASLIAGHNGVIISPSKWRRLSHGCSVSPASAPPPTLSPPLPMKPASPPIQFDFYTVPLHHRHVEDLIELAPATLLLLLIPEDYSSYDDFEEWIQQFT